MGTGIIRLNSELIERLKALNKGSMSDTVRFLTENHTEEKIEAIVKDVLLIGDIEKMVDQKIKSARILIDNTYEPLLDQIQLKLKSLGR